MHKIKYYKVTLRSNFNLMYLGRQHQELKGVKIGTIEVVYKSYPTRTLCREESRF
jgi:hypothetical protein